MSDVIEMKTAELIGPALDWAVAQIEGVGCTPHTIKRFYRPSTDWTQGGPLLDRYPVSLERTIIGCNARAQCWADSSGNQLIGLRCSVGATPLVAICRAIVAANTGDVVLVPIALTGGAA